MIDGSSIRVRHSNCRHRWRCKPRKIKMVITTCEMPQTECRVFKGPLPTAWSDDPQFKRLSLLERLERSFGDISEIWYTFPYTTGLSIDRRFVPKRPKTGECNSLHNCMWDILHESFTTPCAATGLSGVRFLNRAYRK